LRTRCNRGWWPKCFCSNTGPCSPGQGRP